MDALEILDCAAGPRGAELEARAFARTQALIPPHTFVPWVVVNGAPPPLHQQKKRGVSVTVGASGGAAQSPRMEGRLSPQPGGS